MKRAVAVVAMIAMVAVGGCGKSSTLKSPNGNLYRAGENCPKADKGKKTTGSDGKIKCVKTGGTYRWVKS